MSEKLTILANGEKFEIDKNISILDFLNMLNLKSKGTAVELNLEAISPEEFSSIILKQNDKLEIMSIVAGG